MVSLAVLDGKVLPAMKEAPFDRLNVVKLNRLAAVLSLPAASRATEAATLMVTSLNNPGVISTV